jgi:hypothetical protein
MVPVILPDWGKKYNPGNVYRIGPLRQLTTKVKKQHILDLSLRRRKFRSVDILPNNFFPFATISGKE